MPFKESFPMTQDWNDPRYRASYAKFNLLGHNGQDFGLPVGTPVLAPHAGRVIEAPFDVAGYGWYVKIENDKEGSILAHFKESPSVKVGDEVTQGQKVGLSGNTGNSTGAHLHWGYYRFPRKRDNGFSGTVDQTHWFGVDDNNYLDELIEMRASRDKWKNMVQELEDKLISEGRASAEHIKNLQSTAAEQSTQINIMNETIDSATLENKRLSDDSARLRQELIELTTKTQYEVTQLSEEIEQLIEKSSANTAKIKSLEEKLAKGLSGYTVWELFSAVLRR